CLGLAALTRTPLAFMFPLFLAEAWRVCRSTRWAPGPATERAPGPASEQDRGGPPDWALLVRRCAVFAAPVVVLAIVAMVHNHARFDDIWEFGHRYLDVRQQRQMETIGMFSLDYLSRNLAVAMALLPDFSSSAPHVTISGHGLAIWVTSPILFYLLWPQCKNALHRPLWLTAALVAVPTMLYQNSGWYQFGYRFSLDYIPFLLVLLAIGGRPLTRMARALIIIGIIINLFGAITFARHYEYYRVDAKTYSTVIPH
ncbi:MAG: hypothetical protein AAGC55_16765, partial [Myxococcota bacterium]